MLFSSLEYFVFIAVVFALYYLMQRRPGVQILILIVASIYFYAYSSPMPTVILLFVAVLAATISFALIHSRFGHRKLITGIGIAVMLLILAVFKYSGLIVAPLLAPGSGAAAAVLSIVLPIGISFYTFHSISLLVDSYRTPERFQQGSTTLAAHIRNTLLFVTFFPALVAGPIMKAHQLLPQITGKQFRDIDFYVAFKALVVGYFLKMFVADNLSQFTVVLPFRHQWQNLGSPEILALMLAYSAQIYADFAGYSLIAIGTAELFGYRLIANFNFPYLSRSLAEFWRRWHISLSSWLREYLYIPLGGNRKGELRTYVNLLVVMLLGGLWHGADWKFLAWGGWHGAGLAVERFVGEHLRMSMPGRGVWVQNLVALLKCAAVFCFVTLGWLLFSLNSIGDVLPFLGKLVFWQSQRDSLTYARIVAAGLLCLAVALHHLSSLLPRGRLWDLYVAPPAYAIMIILTVLGAGPNVAFIYFQF